jgi:L-seryl-tRNA(Ser) seleniumtransferase
VIVDAASEYDLRVFLEAGADLVVYSAHKFLGGPTAGIVAGREELVRAAYVHQTVGVGRVMKVGKEGIVGAMAALLRWNALDHSALHQREYRRLARMRDHLAGRPELSVEEVPDPTGNPITRLRVSFRDPRPEAVAWLSRELRRGDPSVFVRDHHVDNGFFDLDPCNLDDDEAEALLASVDAILDRSGPPGTARDEGPLGPRRSRYDPRGLPRVDEERVPFLIPRDGDRAERFARWPHLEDS